jgi:glucan 1,3-beta-glucosidase
MLWLAFIKSGTGDGTSNPIDGWSTLCYRSVQSQFVQCANLHSRTYKNLDISSCTTAFAMDNIDQGKNTLQVGSVVIIDSKITDCPTFVSMTWTRDTKPIGAQQLILENIALINVGTAVKGPGGATVLGGGTTTIQAWGQGNKYTPDGPQKFQGSIDAVKRPSGLLDGNVYYSKSKPQYENLGADSFISARTAGARGDGNTDDTTALQNAINSAAQQGKVLFLDQGVYKVTNTIRIPPNARIVGETYPVIMASGGPWQNIANGVAVIRIGNSDESGHIEMSDLIIATQGATPGAKLIEWNMKTDRGSGIWDVHTRIGGAKGTNLQVAQCPKGSQRSECYAAHTNVHITKSASGVYMENNWFWVSPFHHRISLLLTNSITDCGP